MPYKDAEERRKRQQARRKGDAPADAPTQVMPLGDTLDDPAWQSVANFINRDSNTKMTNLEKLQRIAGSLGKYADGVFMGDLTMGQIGRVIGVKEGKY